jgi:hypothetical protein
MIDGRSAADHRSRSNIMRDAALRYGDSSVPDPDVAADAYLSGQDYVVAYIGRAGQTDLSAEQGVVADDATVSNVDHVIDLRAASYAGLAYAGSVDAGIRLDLGIALDYYVSGLQDFVPAAGLAFIRTIILDTILDILVFNIDIFNFCEAEAVGAHYRSILKQDVVSQVAEFSYYGVGVGEEIAAYGCSAVDNCVGQEDCVVSDYGVFVDYYVWTEVRVLA